MENNKSVIDIASGNVFEEFSDDKVMLVGNYFQDRGFCEELEIRVMSIKTQKNINISIPYRGYHLKLFLGDFNGDGKEEIMLRGSLGGSGDFKIAAIYNFFDDNLVRIFDQDVFLAKYKFNAKYLNNYRIEIELEEFNKKFIMDISNQTKAYLDMVYDNNGKVIKNIEPYITGINEACPIDFIQGENYNLFIQQNIIGINSNKLGVMECFLDITNNKYQLIKIGAVNFCNKEEIEDRISLNDILKMLPSKSELISLDRFGGKDKVISIDLNNDGKKEILAAYTLEGVPYIAVFENNVLVDSFEGEGYSIAEVKIFSIGDMKAILVGFKIEEKANKLEILQLDCGKLKKAFKNDFPIYAEAYVEDIKKDGNVEIILWFHDTGEAYTVNIYKIDGEEIKVTDEYDFLYYNKMVEYYKKLLKNKKKSSTYLYYLALALEKTRNYEEALYTVEKALEAEYPYPSVKELNKIIKRLNYE